MEQTFLRELLFLVCFTLVGYQLKADTSKAVTVVVSQFKIESEYKKLIESGKLQANIYGLAAVLTDIQETDTKTYDEVIKYFVSHGCDIREKLDIKKFMTEYGATYGYLTGKYTHKSQDEIQKLIQEAEKMLNSNILTKLFCYFNHGIMTYVSGAPANPYLVQALIQNDADINNLGGILNFFRYTKDYELITGNKACPCGLKDDYLDVSLDVAKHIYKNNSYINRAIMYVLMSKKMYQKISE
jgi:hypothetical protein